MPEAPVRGSAPLRSSSRAGVEEAPERLHQLCLSSSAEVRMAVFGRSPRLAFFLAAGAVEMWETPAAVGRCFPSLGGKVRLHRGFHRTAASIARSLTPRRRAAAVSCARPAGPCSGTPPGVRRSRFEGMQRAIAARSSSLHSGRCSAADRRSISAAACTHLFRGTLAPICETSRAFAAVSAQVFAPRESRPCESACELQLFKQPTENTKAAEVAAGECFRLAGPTGLEPATSGVTARRSNQRRPESRRVVPRQS